VSQILHLIRSAGHSATFQSSTELDWEKSLDESADIVAVSGGDGTVGKVAKRMIGKQTPLAVVTHGYGQ
jgi:diacylglycerol kinase family enzyme